MVGTTTPDLIFPSTACLIQARLGAGVARHWDVNAACSGFIYALSVAEKFIRCGDAKTALVIGTETLSRIVDWTERTTCVLFGDGAGAAVLKADTETGILSTHLHADGSKKELLWNPVGVSTGFKADEPNNGIRIDHLLLSPQCADLLRDAGIDKAVRGGESPRITVPVWVELDA